MFGLPDLIPRDSHTLWYTSSRNAHPQPAAAPQQQPDHNNQLLEEPTRNLTSATPNAGGGHHHHHHHQRRTPNQHLSVDRSPVARLRADEQYLERRRLNVQNFGQTWLRPPGITKTLYQMREERREMEEHQEAIRREQLLADAEAEAASAANRAQPVGAPAADGGAQMLEVGGDGTAAARGDGGTAAEGQAAAGGDEAIERDLDDEIPEGSAQLGDSDEDSDNDSDDEVSSSDEPSSDEGDGDTRRRAEAERDLQNIRAARMGMNHDAFREAIARGGELGVVDPHGYAQDVDDDDDVVGGDGEATHLFEEEDLVHHHQDDMGSGMEHDLDEEIPDADQSGIGGYEHTDSEAELSSSEAEEMTADMNFAAVNSAARPAHGQGGAHFRNRGASDATRQSMDISSMLSGNDSSMIGSSPAIQRMPGPPRRA